MQNACTLEPPSTFSTDLEVLDGCRTLSEFASAFVALAEHERSAFYKHLEQVITYSRRHYIEYGGKTIERENLRALRTSCEESRVVEAEHYEFLFALYLLRRSNLGLEQVRGPFGLASAVHLIEQRLDLYAVHGSSDARSALADASLGSSAKAKRLFSARTEIDTGYYRVSLIDGGAWYRTETLLPREHAAKADIAEAVLLALVAYADLPYERIRADELTAAEVSARNCIEKHGEIEPLLERVMQAIADDPRIGVDTAVLTCPTGLGLENLAAMGEAADAAEHFCAHIAFRSGLEAPEALGPKVTDSARKAIRGRMFQLKLKAVKNCFHASALFGVDVEKAYDYMIYANEDSHYPGHKVARVFTGGRASIKLTVPERRLDLPRGMADLRCFRGRETPEIFTLDEEALVIRYAAVLESILREMLRLNAVVSKALEGGKH